MNLPKSYFNFPKTAVFNALLGIYLLCLEQWVIPFFIGIKGQHYSRNSLESILFWALLMSSVLMILEIGAIRTKKTAFYFRALQKHSTLKAQTNIANVLIAILCIIRLMIHSYIFVQIDDMIILKMRGLLISFLIIKEAFVYAALIRKPKGDSIKPTFAKEVWANVVIFSLISLAMIPFNVYLNEILVLNISDFVHTIREISWLIGLFLVFYATGFVVYLLEQWQMIRVAKDAGFYLLSLLFVFGMFIFPKVNSNDSLLRKGFLRGKAQKELTAAGLAWTVPASICQYNTIKSLNISNGKVNDLPACLGNLDSLTLLNLSNNQFNKIPQAVFSLKNLIELDLSNNQFTTLPTAIKALSKLRFLGIADLEAPPALIPELALLTQLEGMCIAPAQLKSTDILARLPRLNWLIIAIDKTPHTPEWVIPLNELPHLKVIWLSGATVANSQKFLWMERHRVNLQNALDNKNIQVKIIW